MPAAPISSSSSSTATLSRDELKTQLAMIERAHKKNQAVCIGRMNGRLVVRVTPRWNILVRAWYWLQGRKSSEQYRAGLLQTLNDKHTDFTLKKQLYRGITSGALPCFSSTEVARAKANKHSFFRRARISGIDNAASLLSRKTLTPQKSGAFFIQSEQDKQSVIDHYRRTTSKGEISLIQKPADFDKDDLARTISCEPGQSIETSAGRLFSDEPVCLVLDFTSMNPAQIASLNELFDQPPRYQGRQLGAGVSLVCLIHQDMLEGNAANPGPDFWRRMDTLGIQPQLPETSQPVITDDEILAQMVETEWSTAPEAPEGHQSIDFHQQSGHWHSLLFGDLQLSPEGRLEFQEGILAKLDAKSGYVELHNAPTDNPEFVQALATVTREHGFWANGQWIPLPRDLQIVLKQSEPEAINQKLAGLKPVTSGESYVCINEETFEAATANISLANGKLLSSNTLEELLQGQRNLMVSGKLMQSRWVQLINQLHAMKPPVKLCIAPNCPVPKGLDLEQFRLSPELSGHVRLLNASATDLPEALEYDLSSKTQPQTLLSRMPMLSQRDMTFTQHFTPLMTALMEGRPVRLYGLETNPEIARQLESLLTPEPYVFLAGQKIPLPELNLTCAVPPRKTLPGLWQQLTPPPEVEARKIPDGYHQQMTSQNMAQLSGLYDSLRKIPGSAQRLYPDSPQPINNPAVLAKIARQVIQETVSDGCQGTQPYHWRKALNDVIAKEYRGEPEVYSFVKSRIHQCFPDQDNRRVEGDSLRQWLSGHTRATRADVKKHYWQLARYIAPQCLPEITQLAPVPDKNLDALIAIMIQGLPEEQRPQWQSQLACTATPPKPVNFISGGHYRQAYNALVAADVEGRANPGESVHAQALEMSEALESLSQPVDQDDIRAVLSDWFTPKILDSDFKDLAIAMASGKTSQVRQLRRIKKLSEKLQSAPIVMLKGEAGTGKTYTAEAVARQYSPAQEPLILSLSPEHSQEDLFGQDALKPAKVTIEKSQLPFCQHPQAMWQSLCQAAGYPGKSSHIDITFDKKTRQQLQKTLSEDDFFAVTEQFENNHTEFEPGPLMLWAEMKNPPVLILDEANLAKPGVLSPLLGLKKTPPRITIHGRTIELSQQHRIILTGNPESYDGRIIDPELRKEVLTLYYRPMSQAALKEAVFNPALPKHWDPILKDHATSTCMKLYDHFHKVLPDHTFGPRDLKDILARIQQYAGSSSPSIAAVNGIAWQSVLDSLGGEITQNHQRQLRALKHWYHATHPIDTSPVEKAEKSFGRFYQHLQKEHAGDSFDFSVPSVRDLSEKVWRDLEKSAGKHAVIIEGEAGRGKDATLDRLLPTWLKTKGKPPVFQRINASAENWDEIKQLATEAMRDGTILVISELNTLPSRYLEGFFNEVLNGSAAEGFMLIATVNPASYSGREKFSEAMQSRCTSIKIPSFTEPELQGLLARRYPGKTQFTRWLTEKHCRLSGQLSAAGSSVRLPLAKLATSAEAMKELPPEQWQEQFDRQYQLAKTALETKTNSKVTEKTPGDENSRQEREEKLCHLVNQETGSPVTVILQPGAAATYDPALSVLTLPDNPDINALAEQASELLRASSNPAVPGNQAQAHQTGQTFLQQTQQAQQTADPTSETSGDSSVPNSWVLKFMPTSAIAALINKLPMGKAASLLSSVLSLLSLKHVIKLIAMVSWEKLIDLVMKLPLEKLAGLIDYIPLEQIIKIVNHLPLGKLIRFLNMLPLEQIANLLSRINVERLIEIANRLPIEKLVKAFVKLDMEKFADLVDALPMDRMEKLMENVEVDGMEQATSKLSDEKLQSLAEAMPTGDPKYAELLRLLEKRTGQPAATATPRAATRTRPGQETKKTRDSISFDKKPWQEINQLESFKDMTPVEAALARTPESHLSEVPKLMSTEWLRQICVCSGSDKVAHILRGMTKEQWQVVGPRLLTTKIYEVFQHLPQGQADHLLATMPIKALGSKLKDASNDTPPLYPQIARIHKQRLLSPLPEQLAEPMEPGFKERESIYYKKDLKHRIFDKDSLATVYLKTMGKESECTALLLGVVADMARTQQWSGPLSGERAGLLFQRLTRLLTRSGAGEKQERELLAFIRTYRKAASDSHKREPPLAYYQQNSWLLLDGFRSLHHQNLLSGQTYHEILTEVLFNQPDIQDDITISFMEELVNHPVYGQQARQKVNHYYQDILPSHRELTDKLKQMKTEKLFPTPVAPEKFRIEFLEQTLGKQVINQQWSNTPSGNAPDVNRLARRSAAFPLRSAAPEQPTIIFTVHQHELEQSLINYIHQHPPLNLHPGEMTEKDLNEIEERIARLVIGLFNESLQDFHDKAQWKVVNPSQLRYLNLNQTQFELAPGTYGHEALPFMLSHSCNLAGFNELHRSPVYYPRLDRVKVLESHDADNAIVLDNERMNKCLREFMAQIPPEYLYECLF